MNRERYLGVASLVLGTFIGGAFTPALIKIGVQTMPPLTFSFLRVLITFILFAPLFPHYTKQIFREGFWKKWLLLSLFFAANMALFSLAISYTTLTVSQLIYSLLPVVVPIVAYVLIREVPNRKKIVGAMIALVGVFTLVGFSSNENAVTSLGTLYGNSLILLAMFCYTGYLVFSKKLVTNFSPILMTLASHLGIALWMIPLVLLREGITGIELTFSNMLILVALACCSFTQIYFFQWGVKRVSAMTSAIVALLGPEFAAVAGYFLFGEVFSPILIVSLTLVMIGVLISLSGEQQNWRDRFQGWVVRVRQRVIGIRG